ncbi:hypothetical protein [Salegentibacter mishustinae]|uniref:Uncharacterized protein n=1 Tax=Salegentibacter mishustinae TaxID=270918 RepID=A0A0Q9ZBV0_9FLAO|nr:hypothetical protein [Salegentibacter mishustinae]KRG30549.1 hypothetical protein APR42_01395 [Salegentibacter mishustinae]PNW23440.1 hypothetical protein APB85_01390 [Salegentibacter mishustinae]PZX66507.1 hypothetical protein LY54_00905 [Salegentibacter mishustinae]GGW82941.1 hypothetical protein GCM10008086_08690 [Salegentibacter mishustinae]
MQKVSLISIGIIGFIAGIFLTINGNNIMGIAGSVVSAGIAIKGINELRKEKKNNLINKLRRQVHVLNSINFL